MPEPHLIQDDPEDAVCTTCGMPYSYSSFGCEEHSEFWIDPELLSEEDPF
jgi:hypothetical protein